jgi:hypothetical protein
MKICYACEAAKTSDEHVPAESFYPKEIRKNLIKVPSCSRHNNDTSDDDEYVRNLIVTQAENSEAGLALLTGKVFRSFHRNSRLRSATFGTLQHAQNELGAPTLIFQPERSKLDGVMLKIYRGIAFHTTGKQHLNPVNILYRDLKFADLGASNEYDLFKMFDDENILWDGPVQEVFRFRICRPNPASAPIIEIEFYQCFAVLMTPQLETDFTKIFVIQEHL